MLAYWRLSMSVQESHHDAPSSKKWILRYSASLCWQACMKLYVYDRYGPHSPLLGVQGSSPTLLQQSEQAYEINQKFAGRLNNPTLNVELDSLGNSKLKDLDGPTTLLGLSQEIPLSNKLSLRKQVARFQGDRNQFEIAKRQAELKADLRICMANWYVATQRAEVYSTESKLNARQANVLSEN